MKYKSVVFAVHTDGTRPFVPEDLFAMSVCAWFEYDTDAMACIIFAIIPAEINEDAVRVSVPFYEGYQINESKLAWQYENLALELAYYNGEKERPVIEVPK